MLKNGSTRGSSIFFFESEPLAAADGISLKTGEVEVAGPSGVEFARRHLIL